MTREDINEGGEEGVTELVGNCDMIWSVRGKFAEGDKGGGGGADVIKQKKNVIKVAGEDSWVGNAIGWIAVVLHPKEKNDTVSEQPSTKAKQRGKVQRDK